MNETANHDMGSSADRRSWRVCIAPGSGVVSRNGTTVLVAHPQRAEHERLLDVLLDLCAEAAQPESDAQAAAHVRRVVALVAQAEPGSVPGLGLVTVGTDRVLAVLVGDVHLELTVADGSTEQLHGNDATVLVDRVLPAAFDRLLLRGAGDAQPDPRSNLSGGVVSGSGVLVVPGRRSAGLPAADETLVDLGPRTPAPSEQAAAPSEQAAAPSEQAAAPSEPAAAPSEPAAAPPLPVAEFTPISLTDEPDEEPAETPDPTPSPAPAEQPAAPLVQVQGVMCSRQHFNDPRALFCSHCGISMVHQTHNLVTGPRPPLGVLVVDDGSVFSLVKDLVVGREPETAGDVLSGRAAPLLLEDPDLVVSRVHARVVLDGWEVRVEDAGSANGTFVAESEAAEPTRLPPNVPTTVKPGARIVVGGRTLVFESYRGP